MASITKSFSQISPKNLTPDHVGGLSLGEITRQYGAIGLMTRFVDEYQLIVSGLYLPGGLILDEARDRLARQILFGHARALARISMAQAAEQN